MKHCTNNPNEWEIDYSRKFTGNENKFHFFDTKYYCKIYVIFWIYRD